jgi:hypothetical protein
LVFLERKLRTGMTLSKRRTTVDISDLHRLPGPPDRGWPGYWFQQRLDLRRLRVTCQVSYQRVARIGAMVPGGVRLTLDRDIHSVPQTEPAFTADRGVAVSPNHQILELKFRRELPPIFQTLIDGFDLTPLAVSKYRLALEALGAPSDARALAAGMDVEEASLRDA